MIELDDDEARLLYAVVLEKAQEHFSYASTSEVADRLCKLAARFARPTRNLEAVNNSYIEVGRDGSHEERKTESQCRESTLIPRGSGMSKSNWPVRP